MGCYKTNRALLSKVLDKITIPQKNKATIKILGKLANRNQIETEGRTHKTPVSVRVEEICIVPRCVTKASSPIDN